MFERRRLSQADVGSADPRTAGPARASASRIYLFFPADSRVGRDRLRWTCIFVFADVVRQRPMKAAS